MIRVRFLKRATYKVVDEGSTQNRNNRRTEQPTEMMSTMITSSAMYDETFKKQKGFGRGWGHDQKYKTSDKFRHVEKPKKYKDFKLGRNVKSSSLDEEDYGTLNKELFEEVRLSYTKSIIHAWKKFSNIFQYFTIVLNLKVLI